MQLDTQKHEVSQYLRSAHANRHAEARVSQCMNTRHAEGQVDVEVSYGMARRHATGHVDTHVSPRMRPEACETTHMRSGGMFLTSETVSELGLPDRSRCQFVDPRLETMSGLNTNQRIGDLLLSFSDGPLLSLRFHRTIRPDIGRIEKWVLRIAFDDEKNPYLPKSAARATVPGGPSVPCSTAKAVDWDAAWSQNLDMSGRAALGVHVAAYEEDKAEGTILRSYIILQRKLHKSLFED
ncbi:hypothetical protein F2Q70_00011062 [Brassica cretica]|uniref:Uncharacterized protein n=1 Tax=Brassica cretica TaxID=69181 RepID=A0A8S9LUX2_BRACR|nr:hypothetical protein F2Q70_00011062 [Brassica cretica]